LKDKDQTAGGLTCQHCGETGSDVETESIHVGGPGYVKYDYCQDERACWTRWDKQNDLTGWNLEVGIR
ncbi:hypothetical protein LCGC14_1770650, partial [marine sediment metagenome]